MAPVKKKMCCMPYCNNVQELSKKQFFKIEASLKGREWLSRAGKTVSIKSQLLHCCEDHFDLPNDAENYITYKYLPGAKLKLRPNVLPQKKLPMNVCRLCLKLIYNGDDFVDISEQKGRKNAQIIAATLPELDLSITVEPVSCSECFYPLKQYYTIKQNALNSEVIVVNCIRSIVKRSPTRLIKNCEIDLFEEYNDIIALLEKEKETPQTAKDPNTESNITQNDLEFMRDKQDTEKSTEEIVIHIEEPIGDKSNIGTIQETTVGSNLCKLLEGVTNDRSLKSLAIDQATFSVVENVSYTRIPESNSPETSRGKSHFHVTDMESLQNISNNSVKNSGNLQYEIVENPVELPSEDMYLQIEKEDAENVVTVTSQF